ncbi:MAG TPA: CapA family protein [Candidatus Limnocylindrales bacterium]
MLIRTHLRGVTIAVLVLLLAACEPTVTPNPSTGIVPTPQPSTSETVSPSPSPATAANFPLAVVTGMKTLKARITVDEVVSLASSGRLTVPCGVTIKEPAIAPTTPCLAADQIAAAIEANQPLVALLPPGLVQPATKVLPIAGDGPFGMFGPDLFGDPQSRALPYPINGSETEAGTLDPAWYAYDPATTWTLTTIGSLCADRGAAHQAVTLGKGWDWVFNGGTAKYAGKPYPNPNPPPGITRYPIVKVIETGNAGATSSISKRSDVALANQKCPILPTKSWRPNDNTTALNFAVPEDVLSRWRDFLGIDAVFLPADHQSDRGVTGIRSTLTLLDKYGFAHTGLGMNLNQALEPAYVQVAGLKVAFVSWNEVPGPVRAAANTPGVAWMTQANINAAVRRAKAAGADVIVCDPQWWGGSEYHPDLRNSQVTDLKWMDAAGCDQVIGGGLHLTGAVLFRKQADGVSMVNTGPGNYMFGQGWWQQTQEGVILQLAFRGKTVANLKIIPYVMLAEARADLLNPQGDGRYVLQRLFRSSSLDYLP